MSHRSACCPTFSKRCSQAPGTTADHGSVSVFAVLAVTMLVMFVGVAVDLSGALHAGQRVQDIARQAARTGAEVAHGSTTINGQRATVDPNRGATAARTYLAAANVRGTVSISGSTVSVTTADTYRTVILGLVGIHAIQVTGASTAALTRTLQGATR